MSIQLNYGGWDPGVRYHFFADFTTQKEKKITIKIFEKNTFQDKWCLYF